MRFFLIVGGIILILFRSTIMRFLFGNLPSERQGGGSNRGNVNVDHAPGSKGRQPGDFKGGEYVDYEEVN